MSRYGWRELSFCKYVCFSVLRRERFDCQSLLERFLSQLFEKVLHVKTEQLQSEKAFDELGLAVCDVLSSICVDWQLRQPHTWPR